MLLRSKQKDIKFKKYMDYILTTGITRSIILIIGAILKDKKTKPTKSLKN